MMFFSNGGGAGENRVRRALVPSVLFLFCTALSLPVTGAVAAVLQGREGICGLELALPFLGFGAAAALLVACGAAAAMAGAEAEGDSRMKQRIRNTGFLTVLVAELLICAAGAAFSFRGSLPAELSLGVLRAVAMWLRGMTGAPAAMGLFLYYEILLFAEGNGKTASLISAAACFVHVILMTGVFRVYGGAGFGFSLTGGWLAGAAAAFLFLRRRTGRRGRCGVSAEAALRILKYGIPSAEGPLYLTLTVILLNLYLSLTGREEYLPAAFYALLAYGSMLLLGRGMALGFDPMIRVYRSEGNDKGILLLMQDGFPAVLVLFNLWMVILFLAASIVAGIWIPGTEETVRAGVTAVRLLAPFSVFYCTAVFFAGYYRASGEEGTARFLRVTALLILPVICAGAGVRLGGVNGIWTGAGAAAFLALPVTAAAVRFRTGRSGGNRSGWLLLDRTNCSRQFYEICRALPEDTDVMTARAEVFLRKEKVPDYEQYRILQLLRDLLAGICGRAAEEGVPFRIDCTITGGRSFQVIVRDDGPLTDKADPRHTICSFRMYGLSRSVRTGADASLAPASGENRTVFRM